jgi:predicted esterase
LTNQLTLSSRSTFILQAVAAGWHHKTPAQLAKLATSVGPHRIMVVHGTLDRMITYPHALDLLDGLRGGSGGSNDGTIEEHLVQGQAHVIPLEMRADFNSWIANFIERTEGLAKN